jgi:hypothetical protein
LGVKPVDSVKLCQRLAAHLRVGAQYLDAEASGFHSTDLGPTCGVNVVLAARVTELDRGVEAPDDDLRIFPGSIVAGRACDEAVIREVKALATFTAGRRLGRHGRLDAE